MVVGAAEIDSFTTDTGATGLAVFLLDAPFPQSPAGQYEVEDDRDDEEVEVLIVVVVGATETGSLTSDTVAAGLEVFLLVGAPPQVGGQ